MVSNKVLKEKKLNNQTDEIGFSVPVTVDFSTHKKVLITGANSYIGISFKNYAKKNMGLISR